jgi:hypothetical protein
MARPISVRDHQRTSRISPQVRIRIWGRSRRACSRSVAWATGLGQEAKLEATPIAVEWKRGNRVVYGSWLVSAP